MVENQEDEAYLPWGAYNDITAEYPDTWAEYASSTLKYHVGDMVDYTVTKAAGLLNQPFLNDQPYTHLWYYKSFGSAVRTLLFNVKVVQVLQFLIAELVYSFTWWAVKKRINWLGLGLAGCSLATMVTSVGVPPVRVAGPQGRAAGSIIKLWFSAHRPAMGGAFLHMQ